MSILSRIVNTVKARFEAAEDRPSRSTINNPVRSATRDITRLTRRRLIAKSRFFYENSPLYSLLIERLVSYVVGNGLTVVPKTSDASFNQQVHRLWSQWCKKPDITSKHNFIALQSLICRSILVDGDCLSIFTFDNQGNPKIQCLESHRICDQIAASQDSPDGCVLGDYNEVLGYNYSITEDKISFDFIDAQDAVLHIFPKRLNQYRGIPVATSAINTLHDIDDILKLEKQSVKENSSHSGVIYRGKGEMDLGEVLKGGAEEKSIEDRQKYYRQVQGSELMILEDGDQYSQIDNSRPSQVWQGFMLWLCEMTCASTGIPASVVLGVKLAVPILGATSQPQSAS